MSPASMVPPSISRTRPTVQQSSADYSGAADVVAESATMGPSSPELRSWLRAREATGVAGRNRASRQRHGPSQAACSSPSPLPPLGRLALPVSCAGVVPTGLQLPATLSTTAGVRPRRGSVNGCGVREAAGSGREQTVPTRPVERRFASRPGRRVRLAASRAPAHITQHRRLSRAGQP
jgi:hypothetical protein